jgi:hypothetical protein
MYKILYSFEKTFINNKRYVTFNTHDYSKLLKVEKIIDEQRSSVKQILLNRGLILLYFVNKASSRN